MTDHLILPVLSINGTSLACRADELREVAHKMQGAIDALRDAHPNMRDFVGDPSRWNAKREEHLARLLALESMRFTLLEEAEWMMDRYFESESRYAKKL